MNLLLWLILLYGADVSTEFDTILFLAGGAVVFIIALVFWVMLKGGGKRS